MLRSGRNSDCAASARCIAGPAPSPVNPRSLRGRQAGVTVAFVWRVPFPVHEVFRRDIRPLDTAPCRRKRFRSRRRVDTTSTDRGSVEARLAATAYVFAALTSPPADPAASGVGIGRKGKRNAVVRCSRQALSHRRKVGGETLRTARDFHRGHRQGAYVIPAKRSSTSGGLSMRAGRAHRRQRRITKHPMSNGSRGRRGLFAQLGRASA